MKKYKVVQPIMINPNEPLGIQEDMNIEARDLVNVEDPEDRYMANPDDFETIDEIISEDEFYTEDCQYVDDQSVGSAPFAFRK